MPPGRLVQLVRTPRLHRGGRPFESAIAHSSETRGILCFPAFPCVSWGCGLGSSPRAQLSGIDGHLHGLPGVGANPGANSEALFKPVDLGVTDGWTERASLVFGVAFSVPVARTAFALTPACPLSPESGSAGKASIAPATSKSFGSVYTFMVRSILLCRMAACAVRGRYPALAEVRPERVPQSVYVHRPGPLIPLGNAGKAQVPVKDTDQGDGDRKQWRVSRQPVYGGRCWQVCRSEHQKRPGRVFCPGRLAGQTEPSAPLQRLAGGPAFAASHSRRSAARSARRGIVEPWRFFSSAASSTT